MKWGVSANFCALSYYTYLTYCTFFKYCVFFGLFQNKLFFAWGVKNFFYDSGSVFFCGSGIFRYLMAVALLMPMVSAISLSVACGFSVFIWWHLIIFSVLLSCMFFFFSSLSFVSSSCVLLDLFCRSNSSCASLIFCCVCFFAMSFHLICISFRCCLVSSMISL